MPFSDRVRDSIVRNPKSGSVIAIFSDTSDNPIRLGEFKGIIDNKEDKLLWNEIQSLTFKNINSLKGLPILPTDLKELILENTSIETIPILPKLLDSLVLVQNNSIKSLPNLPKSLRSIVLIENRSLHPPEKLPISLRRITLIDNDFKILPDMPNIDIKYLNINESNLDDIFIRVYELYLRSKKHYERVRYDNHSISEFFIQLHAIWDYIHSKGIINTKKANAKEIASHLKNVFKSYKVPSNLVKITSSYLNNKYLGDMHIRNIIEKNNNNIVGGKKNLTRRRRQIKRKTYRRR